LVNGYLGKNLLKIQLTFWFCVLLRLFFPWFLELFCSWLFNWVLSNWNPPQATRNL